MAKSQVRVLMKFNKPREFASRLVDVLLKGQVPILLPNLLPGTIQSFANEFDEVLEPQSPGKYSTSDLKAKIAAVDPSSSIILFTSGSTGVPQKIAKTFTQLLTEVEMIEETFSHLPKTIKIESTVSHQHIYGLLFRVLWPGAMGREFSETNLEFPEQILALSSPCILITSPAFLKRLGTIQVPRQKCVEVISSGGELPREVAESVAKILGIAPFEILGSTETGGIAFRRQLEGGDSLWQTFPLVKASATAEGLLNVTSPFLYGPNSDGGITLSDKVQFFSEDRFKLYGRADRTVKIEEKRVSLTEMEQILQTHPCVSEAVTFSLEKGRQQIHCVIELTKCGLEAYEKTGRVALNKILKQHLGSRFEPILWPRRFRYVHKLPRNSQDKIEHLELERLFDET